MHKSNFVSYSRILHHVTCEKEKTKAKQMKLNESLMLSIGCQIIVLKDIEKYTDNAVKRTAGHRKSKVSYFFKPAKYAPAYNGTQQNYFVRYKVLFYCRWVNVLAWLFINITDQIETHL